MTNISDLLHTCHRSKASDLHISAKKKPMLRLHGEMIALDNMPELTPEAAKSLLYSIMTDYQRSQFEQDLELDFALSFSDDMRFRVNVFNTIDGVAAVFRTIPTKVLSLDQINAPEIFKQIANKHKGLVLVTGPTGSGKSTTLAAMINYINEHHKKHIITIEDPIEFVHRSKMSLVNQREVGGQTKSFARALKSALREDPDIILVGEMRDLEAIHLAITAAETGHLVFGTLHTSSAPKTIDRIVDVFPAGDKDMIRSMLASSLEAVITQSLLKKKTGDGRVAAFEILLGIPAVRNLIREGKIAQMPSIMQISSKHGMVLMKDAIYSLLKDNLITEEEAKSYFGTVEEDDKNAVKSRNTNTGAF